MRTCCGPGVGATGSGLAVAESIQAEQRELLENLTHLAVALDPLSSRIFPGGRDVDGAVLAVEAHAQTQGRVFEVGPLLAPAGLLAALALDLEQTRLPRSRPGSLRRSRRRE